MAPPSRARRESRDLASAIVTVEPGRSSARQRAAISGRDSSAISTVRPSETARSAVSFARRSATPTGAARSRANGSPGLRRTAEISGATAASSWISAAREWNSSSTKSCLSFGASAVVRRNASGSNGISRSVGISTRLREIRASSLCSRRLSPTFPLTSSARARSVGRSPYSAIHFLAVTSPTRGTPGMLSTLSPMSASTSATWPGATPKNSRTPASSRNFSRPVWKTRTRGPTSWSMSLSAVTMTTSNPIADAFFASVPMTSSAS